MPLLPPSPRKLLEQAGLVQDAPLSETPGRNLGRWLLSGVALVAVLAILSGKNPDQLALPFLFTLGFSVVIGISLGELAQMLKINKPRLVWPYVAVLTLAGLVGVTGQWYGRYQTRTAEAYRQNPLHEDPLAGAFPAELPADAKPEMREFYENMQRGNTQRSAWKRERAEALTLTGYLKNRLTGFAPLRGLAAPWPAVIWTAEVVVCSVLAGWIAKRNSTSVPAVPTDSVVDPPSPSA